MKMNLSKNQQDFINLFEGNPKIVLESLSDIDILKPLIWKHSIQNGGKYGYRELANKFNLSESTVRTILKNIKNQNGVRDMINNKQNKKD